MKMKKMVRKDKTKKPEIGKTSFPYSEVLHEKLQKAADAEGRTLSNYVKNVLNQFCESESKLVLTNLPKDMKTKTLSIKLKNNNPKVLKERADKFNISKSLLIRQILENKLREK